MLLTCAELKFYTISWDAHKCSDSRPLLQACKTGNGTTRLTADFLSGQWASLVSTDAQASSTEAGEVVIIIPSEGRELRLGDIQLLA